MDKIIYHSIILKCNPHKAFGMFTTNKHLEKWLMWSPRLVENMSCFGIQKIRKMTAQSSVKSWLSI